MGSTAQEIAAILLRELTREAAIAYAERIALAGGDLAPSYADAALLLMDGRLPGRGNANGGPSESHRLAVAQPKDGKAGVAPRPSSHDWDDDAVCRRCGFDGAEYVWWRETYEGRAMRTPMPKCEP